MKTPAIIEALGALAHEHRLAIYRLLVQRGPEGLPAGAIGDRVGLVPSSLTFHLQNLQRAGLITQRRESRQLIYSRRLRRDERVGRLFDGELLRQQRRRMFSELRACCAGKDRQARGQSGVGPPDVRTAHDPWTTASIRRGGLASSARLAGLGYHGRASGALLLRRLRRLADRAGGT